MKYRDCIGTNVIEIERQNNGGGGDGDGDGDGVGLKHRGKKKEGILALYRRIVEEEVVEIADDDNMKDDSNKNDTTNVNNDKRDISLDAFSSSCIPNACYSSIYVGSQERKDDEENNGILYLSITDGSDTYHGRINSETIKLPFAMQNMYEEVENEQEKNKKKYEWLTDILLHIKKEITIIYQQSSGSNIRYSQSQYSSYEGIIHSDNSKSASEDDKFIKIIIKQSERDMVRIVYKGELLQSSAIQNEDNNSYTSETRILGSNLNKRQQNDIMDFLHSITTSYNQSISLINMVKHKNKKLEKELYGWKDTATKLEHSWQNEKVETLQRYLVLLNRVKSDLRYAKEELKKEKSKCALLKKKYTTTRNAYVADNNHRRNAVIDHEDEHDIEMFDDEEVRLLAQGKRVDTNLTKKTESLKRETFTKSKHSAISGSMARASGTATKMKIPQKSSCSGLYSFVPTPMQSSEHSQHFSHSQNVHSQSSVRENPHTGSIEVWNVDDLLIDCNNSGAGNIPDHNISSQLSPCPSPSDKDYSLPQMASSFQSLGENDEKKKKLDSALRNKGKTRPRVDNSNKKKRIKRVRLSNDFTISEEL